MKNSDKFWASVFGLIFGIGAGFCFGLAYCGDEIYESGKQQIRLEATEAGVAQFVADPKTGVTEFRWNTVESMLRKVHDQQKGQNVNSSGN